jgi:putative endonuclease
VTYFVYMMTNGNRDVLYIGMTNNLERRVAEHQTHALKGFTDNYNVTTLVYFESFDDPTTAIAREKQLKGWTRKKKDSLIERVNPLWKDLSMNFDLSS